MATKKKAGKKRGPQPQRLKIEGGWLEAIARAMKAGKPKAAKKKAKRRKAALVSD